VLGGGVDEEGGVVFGGVGVGVVADRLEKLLVLFFGATPVAAAGDEVLEKMAESPAEPRAFINAAGECVAADGGNGGRDPLGDDDRPFLRTEMISSF